MDTDRPITIQDLRSLQCLRLANCNITSIEILQYCDNLYLLDLSNNNISDISPIAHKIHACSLLDLNNNHITDVSEIHAVGAQTSYANDQSIIMPLETVNGTLVLKNPYSNCCTITNISNNGFYNKIDNTICWSNLKGNNNLTFDASYYWCPHLILTYSAHVEVPCYSDDSINIEDEGLKEAITNTLGKDNSSLLTHDELNLITSLDASNKNIKSLKVIENCQNLKKLNLANNNISNLSSLTFLKSLCSLNLSNNSVENILNLEYLNFSHNNISKLWFYLQNLTSLTNLICSITKYTILIH